MMHMKIKNIYYLFWVDAIISYKKYNPEKLNWKRFIFLFISFINGINLWIILIWLKYFKIIIVPEFTVNIFPGKTLNNSLTFILIFVFPFIVLNYFLIFYKDRYKKIIAKYPMPKKKFAFIYLIAVIWLAFLSAILYGVLTGTIFPK